MQILKTMLSSKKFIAMIVGLLATLIAKLGWGDVSDTATVNAAVALVISYVLGQGLADCSKEAEKVKAENGNGKS